jgi:hypothetical protein
MDQLTSTYLAKQDWEAAAELYPNTSKKKRGRRRRRRVGRRLGGGGK